ncbi:hypothetical protein SAMN04488030_2403 [Aliiroseovarius halocynthiae]|nr:hypothetical protein [Aliiroseovarius halocynthiae]SMR82064.1 hypothetical protein SAMN04488030_2403 [Aliiroseovarius halocynthiae]
MSIVDNGHLEVVYGGQVKAVYELTPDGEPVLITLFPIGGSR